MITPTLQRADFLEQTLRSVRAQTHPNVEHIVVDGGSTDGTVELLEQYARTYSLRWISEPDRGMYDAINKGLRMATGDILAYLNSDDLYFPWSAERAVKECQEQPEADVVFGDVIRVDEIRGVTVPIFVPPYWAAPMAAFGTLSQPAVFVRRRVLEAMGGFDDALRYVADLEFWLRAGRNFRFARMSEFIALERRHADMLSEASRARMAAEDVRVRGEYSVGLWSTPAGRLIAYLRWHWWSGKRWFAFAQAARNGAPGWDRTIDACRPSINARTAILGILPSKGSRLRGAVKWASDPMLVAAGQGAEPAA